MPLPFVDADFPDTGEPVRASRMDLHRASHRHEVAVFRVHSDYAARHPTGAPIRVSWGSFPSVRETFYGYVHHDEPRGDDSPKSRASRPTTDLVCVGVTSVLGEEASRSWLNTRLDLLVAEAADREGLIPVVQTATSPVSDVIQPAQSTWKFLTERAKGEGKIMFGLGPRVVLTDRESAARELLPYAPVITRSEAVSISGLSGELNVIDRQEVNRESYSLSSQGLVAATDRSRTTDRGPRRHARERKILTGHAASDANGLRSRIEGKRREESFLHEFTVEVPGIRFGTVPCSVVNLRGFGRRYDGGWSVDSVRYRVDTEGDSTTEISLVKVPALAGTENISRRAGTPGRSGHSSGEMRLVGGRWVASRKVRA